MIVLILKGTINLVLIAVWIIFVIQAFSQIILAIQTISQPQFYMHIIVSLIATLIARVFTDLLIPMDSEN